MVFILVFSLVFALVIFGIYQYGYHMGQASKNTKSIDVEPVVKQANEISKGITNIMSFDGKKQRKDGV